MQDKHVTMTKQRQAILEALYSVVTHPTADEVHHMVRKSLPKVSLGTVYRNLESMSQSGLILKLNTAGVQKRFDGTAKPHYHIRCRECGKVDDVDVPPICTLNQAAEDASGYKVIGHSVEFVGVCPDCSESDEEPYKEA